MALATFATFLLTQQAALLPTPTLLSTRPTREPPRLHALEPSAWSEWSLRDVGLLDGGALSVVLGAGYLLSSQPDTSDAAVREAEQRVIDSVENSPCNGPSIEALEALEAADAKAAAGDPNELPGLFAQLRRRSGPPPSMMARGDELARSTRLNRQAYNRRNLNIDERRALDELLAKREADAKARPPTGPPPPPALLPTPSGALPALWVAQVRNAVLAAAVVAAGGAYLLLGDPQ